MADKAEHNNSYMKTAALVVLILIVVLVGAMRLLHKTAAPQKMTPEEYNAKMQQELNAYIETVFPSDKQPLSALSPTALGPEEQQSTAVEFIARDGNPINGYISKPQGEGPFPTIIILHGGQSSNHAADIASQLLGERLTEELNVNTLSIDWRSSAFGTGDVIDVISAVDWVRSLAEAKDQPVFLFGMDHGAYIALRATEEVQVDGLIDAYGYGDVYEQYQYLIQQNPESAESFLTTTGCKATVDNDSCLRQLSVVDTLDITMPTLIIHAQDDTIVPLAQSHQLKEHIDDDHVTLLTLKADTPEEVIEHDFLSSKTAVGFDEGFTAIQDWLTEQID